MSDPRWPRLVHLLVGVAACAGGPVEVTTADSATTTDSATSADSDTSTTTATTTATAGSTTIDPTTTSTTTTSTTEPTTTSSSESTTTSTTSTTSTTAASTTGGPAECGPPCDAAWEQFGDLGVDAAPADYSCLTRVHGDLFVSKTADPQTLATLANLQRVDGELALWGPPELTDLSTLACLREVGALELGAMPQLADLTALSGLQAAPKITLRELAITALPSFAPDFAGVEDLTLTLNPALSDLAAASTWGASGPSLTIEVFSDPALQDLAGLAGLIASNGAKPLVIHLDDLAGLTSIAGLETVTKGTLFFSGLPELVDLAPLANLKTAGSVHLIDLPKVTSLAGLHNLEHAQWLMIGDCVNMGSGGMNGLTSLDGLESLTSVGSLALANNEGLVSLKGAPLLTVASDGVNAVNNPGLTPAAFADFLEQFAPTPTNCHGSWEQCPCFEILPW